MKYLIILLSLLALAYGQEPQNIDTSKLSKALRLGDVELKIENVTERESAARGLPLKSAWIVSVPGYPLFFPMIIYTSEMGVINDSSIEKLRNSFKESKKSSNNVLKQFGVFNISGAGECIVFLDELRISSNKPEGVDGVIVPWRPNHKAALSIIGTVKEQKLDFQIALLFADEDKISEFPEYKSILYGPNFPVLKELAAELVVALSHSEILPAIKVSSVNLNSNGTDEETNKISSYSISSLWPWLTGAAVLLVALLVGIWKIRSVSRNC